MTNSKSYSPEVRERAVRMVFEHTERPHKPSMRLCVEAPASITLLDLSIRTWLQSALSTITPSGQFHPHPHKAYSTN